MLAYDTRPNAAALKSHDDPELPPEPLALPPKRGEWKLRLAYGLSAIAILLSVGAWLGAPARTVTVLTLIPTATVAFSIPPDAGETWNVDPIVSGGVETKIGTARYYYNNSLCGLVAAAVANHSAPAFSASFAGSRRGREHPCPPDAALDPQGCVLSQRASGANT